MYDAGVLAEGLRQEGGVLLRSDRLISQYAEESDKQPVFVTGAAGHDRHLVKSAFRQHLGGQLWEDGIGVPERHRARKRDEILHRYLA
jgi:hypothetical protein